MDLIFSSIKKKIITFVTNIATILTFSKYVF